MPVFHTFTAGGKRYMFDANTNVIINLKEDLYFELEKYMQSGYKEITPAIEKLRDRIRIMKEDLEEKSIKFDFNLKYKEISINEVFDLQR